MVQRLASQQKNLLTASQQLPPLRRPMSPHLQPRLVVMSHQMEALPLLEAALLPNKTTILHCRGHQKGSLISTYKNAADQKTKEIALPHTSLQSPVILALTPSDPPTTREILSYLHSLFHPSSKTLQNFLRNHFPI